jgi:hypothetical protein
MNASVQFQPNEPSACGAVATAAVGAFSDFTLFRGPKHEVSSLKDGYDDRGDYEHNPMLECSWSLPPRANSADRRGTSKNHKPPQRDSVLQSVV